MAERISQMEEVESIYLMSGAFDLTVFVTDKSFHDVAMHIATEVNVRYLKKWSVKKKRNVLFSKPKTNIGRKYKTAVKD